MAACSSMLASQRAKLELVPRVFKCRLAAVQLVDAHLCTDAGKYLSALLLCLSTMLHLELPHVNLLSKVDLLPSYGDLAFNLDFYTEVQLSSRCISSWLLYRTFIFGMQFQRAQPALAASMQAAHRASSKAAVDTKISRPQAIPRSTCLVQMLN